MLLLTVSFVFLALCLYVALSYRAWQMQQGLVTLHTTPEQTTRAAVRVLSHKAEAFLKAALHVCVYYALEIGKLASNEVKSWVFKAFPRLKIALTEKDKLTGLYHGPASFFLANVSEYKTETVRTPQQRRKVL
ncbi:MAG TPA: hypothetical protein VLB02_01665 [Candidatus Paceibacterota bacterium]|nr:hypothetical protein [Candidatus Paceibacterota bacterium]